MRGKVHKTQAETQWSSRASQIVFIHIHGSFIQWQIDNPDMFTPLITVDLHYCFHFINGTSISFQYIDFFQVSNAAVWAASFQSICGKMSHTTILKSNCNRSKVEKVVRGQNCIW
jgi:hypothetical protein